MRYFEREESDRNHYTQEPYLSRVRQPIQFYWKAENHLYFGTGQFGPCEYLPAEAFHLKVRRRGREIESWTTPASRANRQPPRAVLTKEEMNPQADKTACPALLGAPKKRPRHVHRRGLFDWRKSFIWRLFLSSLSASQSPPRQRLQDKARSEKTPLSTGRGLRSWCAES